jgi:hypothetical protein
MEKLHDMLLINTTHILFSCEQLQKWQQAVTILQIYKQVSDWRLGTLWTNVGHVIPWQLS